MWYLSTSVSDASHRVNTKEYFALIKNFTGPDLEAG